MTAVIVDATANRIANVIQIAIADAIAQTKNKVYYIADFKLYRFIF